MWSCRLVSPGVISCRFSGKSLHMWRGCAPSNVSVVKRPRCDDGESGRRSDVRAWR